MSTSRLLPLLLSLTLLACSDPPEEEPSDRADLGDTTDMAAAPCAPYAVQGPETVGVRTFEIDGMPVEVWYPADSASAEGLEPEAYDLRDWLPERERDKLPMDAPTTMETIAYRDLPIKAGAEPMPVVLFSHGLAGYRSQSSAYTAHLASWGFVVFSPEHEKRNLTAVLSGKLSFTNSGDVGELAEVLDHLRVANMDAEDFFYQRLDLDKIAATGHSAGGRATFALAARSDSPVKALVGLAPAVGTSPDSPQLNLAQPKTLMTASNDGLTKPDDIRGFYDREPTPKRYVEFEGAGHVTFSDICLIGREQGGILRIARLNGLNVNPLVLSLGRDGCRDTDRRAEIFWPAYHHLAVAQLRLSFGLDSGEVVDFSKTSSCFEGQISEQDEAAE